LIDIIKILVKKSSSLGIMQCNVPCMQDQNLVFCSHLKTHWQLAQVK